MKPYWLKACNIGCRTKFLFQENSVYRCPTSDRSNAYTKGSRYHDLRTDKNFHSLDEVVHSILVAVDKAMTDRKVDTAKAEDTDIRGNQDNRGSQDTNRLSCKHR